MKADDALLFKARNLPPKGASCGSCIFRLANDQACAILSRRHVSFDHGVCGLYIWGDPRFEERICTLSDGEAAYIEGPEVPTQCGKCFYFTRAGDSNSGWCHELDLEVNARQCCNAWKPVAATIKEESEEDD